MKTKYFYCVLLICSSFSILTSQVFSGENKLNEHEIQEKYNNDYRSWWDVKHYDLFINPNFNQRYLEGKNTISFDIYKKSIMQLDLQNPMKIDSILSSTQENITFFKINNFYYLELPYYYKDYSKNNRITIYFSGYPQLAKQAPWDGGWVFTLDQENKEWMSVACEGIGASIWFPCKEYLGDEPENGARITIRTKSGIKGISNGKLIQIIQDNNSRQEFIWEVKNPINNYNIIPYIGNYVHFSDSYAGENGILTLDYWVLPYNLDKAKNQFQQVKKMLRAFEYWFGPYPFYEDGYKLVESPYLGMEHQSAIAYGNLYENGYLGTDRSNTGIGLNWDFIIIHESGHEWFGNNITNKSKSDMWIHESFTTYSETLYTEYYFGKELANQYIIGQRKNILNDIPIIGNYEQNKTGSQDMYDKGANLLHTIRQIINNDEKFRSILRGLNLDFFHKTVTTQEIENYISIKSKIDFSKIFDQYLRTTKIPVLEYYTKNNNFYYRWNQIVPGFNMSIKTSYGILKPGSQWKKINLKKNEIPFEVDDNYYIIKKKI